MSGSRQQVLLEARKLVRSLGSAPDPRRRAQALISELKQAQGWSADALREIAVVESWLQASPLLATLEPRLRALVARLAELPPSAGVRT